MGSLWFFVFIFLIVAAALGFAIGWLMRGARVEEAARGAPAREGVEAALAEERDRLRAELRAARERHTQLEGTVAEAQSLAETRAARVRELEAERATLRQQPAAPADPAPPEAEGTPPEGIAAPEGEPDNLKKIRGIGPSIEKTLHELGIYHFRQIAAFTPDNVAWVNQRLSFKGRIEREDWIGQAQQLAGSEEE